MKKVMVISGLLSFLVAPLIFILLIAGGASTSADVGTNVSLNQEQAIFVSRVLPGALRGFEKGLFPSITIAQAIHESAWGQSSLAARYNNLFGVKADSSWSGPVIEIPTQEEVNGGIITIVARWRVYESWDAAIDDRITFLTENRRYQEAGVFDAPNYIEQAQALQRAGYATDSSYAEKLIKTIETYSLYLYDIAPGSGNEIIEKAITAGLEIVGKSPYIFGGGRTPEDIEALRFDCSSFVHWCYSKAGINLGDYRTVVTWSLVNMGSPINKEDMKRGDLIFFDTEGVTNNHVGIYLGNNTFLHDAEPKGVGIDSLDNTYWKNAFNGNVRRVIN